jgi:hypothetical protein
MQIDDYTVASLVRNFANMIHFYGEKLAALPAALGDTSFES